MSNDDEHDDDRDNYSKHPRLDLLTEIHQDVMYIKRELKKHIAEDAEINQKMLYPLWDKHQQNKGAAHLSALLYSSIGSCATIIIAYVSGIVHK